MPLGSSGLEVKLLPSFLNFSEEEASNINSEMTKYESQWKEAIYYVDPKKTNIREFEQLFEKAYKKLTGSK